MKEPIKLKKRLPRIKAIHFNEWTGDYNEVIGLVNSYTPYKTVWEKYERHRKEKDGVFSGVDTLLTLHLRKKQDDGRGCLELSIKPGQYIVIENDNIHVADEQDLLMDWEADD